MRFYVDIEHLTDDQLGFLGYTLVSENADFKMYNQYNGNEHIVDKNGRKFLYVDDLNDAIAMQVTEIVQLPNV